MQTPAQKKDAEKARAKYHNDKEYREHKLLQNREWAKNNHEKINLRKITPERRKQKAKAQARYRKKMREFGLYSQLRGDRTAQTGRWQTKPENKIKRKAHQIVYCAVKIGKLKRESCEKCGKHALAHHDDYAKPLEVRWLCAYHHYEHHKTIG